MSTLFQFPTTEAGKLAWRMHDIASEIECSADACFDLTYPGESDLEAGAKPHVKLHIAYMNDAAEIPVDAASDDHEQAARGIAAQMRELAGRLLLAAAELEESFADEEAA